MVSERPGDPAVLPHPQQESFAEDTRGRVTSGTSRGHALAVRKSRAVEFRRPLAASARRCAAGAHPPVAPEARSVAMRCLVGLACLLAGLLASALSASGSRARGSPSTGKTQFVRVTTSSSLEKPALKAGTPDAAKHRGSVVLRTKGGGWRCDRGSKPGAPLRFCSEAY